MDEGDICVVCTKEIRKSKRHKTAECEYWGCKRTSCCIGPAIETYNSRTRNRGRGLPYQCVDCLRSWCKYHEEKGADWRECEGCDADLVCDMCWYQNYSTCPGCNKIVCTGGKNQCWYTDAGYEKCQRCIEREVKTKRKKRKKKK